MDELLHAHQVPFEAQTKDQSLVSPPFWLDPQETLEYRRRPWRKLRWRAE
ncbi:MAG TPA: hypothetical protein VNG51_03125 [Ktedonobacteraceae bacterium]|nr:hypothetical protein [Ktedonobacteraceae bacterium]